MRDAYPSPHPQKRIRTRDAEMAYVDTGPADGDPIVFLHGNPTSSYLWRNVIPHVEQFGRCLAPDLVGMGNSDPSPREAYRFEDHAAYLDAWFEGLGLGRNVILVVHDWGSALGFHWARRHPDRVQGIAYMESIVRPRTWADFPEGRDQLFRTLRGPEGEEKVLDHNFFVEVVLPKSIKRKLNVDEMDAYRAPFRAPGRGRLPTLVWPRELPIEGEPADVVTVVEEYGAWLAGSEIPKLFIDADPGAILIAQSRDFCRTWPNQYEVTVDGIHFVQEDSADEIGKALAAFVEGLRC